MKNIPYGKQYIDNKDIASVGKTLKNEKITTGKEVINFEKKLSFYLGSKYTLTCNNGTSALFLAFKSINLKKNDIVIMPSINFISSYNVAKILGAKVYLADIDFYTGQMTPKNVEDCCKKFNLKKIKAIVVMYMGGYPYNADKFVKFKKKYKSYIIEDACHAFGSHYYSNNNKYLIGSCKHSDIATFSFHPVKSITTGEGGAVTTNSKKIFNKLKLLRSLGIFREKKNHWSYDIVHNTLNFRLTDFQCSLGISQLKKINKFLTYRKKISDIYDKKLNKIPNLIITKQNENYCSSNHLYIIKLKINDKKIKTKFINYMLKNRVTLQYHYIPINKFKVFNDRFLDFNAKKYYNQAISLPIYYKLPQKKINYIIKKIEFFFKKKYY